MPIKRSRTIPNWDVPAGVHASNKGTAGAITRLCNRLLDVIVSDKVRSQRSFQSPCCRMQHHCWVYRGWHTSGPLRAFSVSSHEAVTMFSRISLHAWLYAQAAYVTGSHPIIHTHTQQIPYNTITVGLKRIHYSKCCDACGSAEHGSLLCVISEGAESD